MPRGRKKKEEQVLDIQIHEDVWAQCDECQKWRRLPPGTILDESQPWYCKLNPDKKYNSCSFSEEDWQNSGDKEISAAVGAELKAEAAKLALKKAAGHDLSAGAGSGRGRKRQTDNDLSWGFMPKKIKSSDVEAASIAVAAGPVAMTSHAPAAAQAPQLAPQSSAAAVITTTTAAAANMTFPTLHEELKALSNGCSRILNNAGTWEPMRPNGHMSQDHINIPQWFWIGMQNLVPQAAALAAAAVEVLTALQYSVSNSQHTGSASNTTQQAELYVRLSLMSAASMLQPVVKLAIQGGDVAAAIAAATKPALPQPTQGAVATQQPAATAAPPPAPSQTPFPSPAGSPFPAPVQTPVSKSITMDHVSNAVQVSGQASRPPPPPQPSAATGPSAPSAPTTAPASPSATPTTTSPVIAVPVPLPTTRTTAAAAVVTPAAAPSAPTVTPAPAMDGPTATAGASGGRTGAAAAPGGGGGSSQRPGGSAAGSLSRASSPGTTSTAPTDTGAGSSGRGESRERRNPREHEQREPRPPRERQRDPAYEKHLQRQGQQAQQAAPSYQGPGRPGSDRERDRGPDRERDRRDGNVAREREHRRESSRERDGPQYPPQPHSHYSQSHYREGRERERNTGPESPRQGPNHGYGADSGGGSGRDWHDGRSERRDSRERERPYDRQGPPPQLGYSGGSGGVGRDHREGPYNHHGSGYRGDRDRDHHGHEGPLRAGERDSYYRGGGGGPRYGGYPPESHRSDRDRGRGGSGGPPDWGGRERDWDTAYDGSGGYYEGGTGTGPYGSSRSGSGPPPSHRGPPLYGNESYGPPSSYSQQGYSQPGSQSQAGLTGNISPTNRDRVPLRGPPSSYQPSPHHPPHPPGGGPPPPPGASSSTVPSAPPVGPRPVPLPPSLSSLPPETVAKILQDQGHTVKSVHIVNPAQPPSSQQNATVPAGRPGSLSGPSPYASGPQPASTTGQGPASAQPMTVAQIRAAAAAAAAQKQQQVGVMSQGYAHGSGPSRGVLGNSAKR